MNKKIIQRYIDLICEAGAIISFCSLFSYHFSDR